MATKKTTPTPRKGRAQNYLNNARLLENIIASKKTWTARRDKALKVWVKANRPTLKKWVEEVRTGEEFKNIEEFKTYAAYFAATDTKNQKIPTLNLVELELPKLEDEDYFPSAAECMTEELVKMIMMLVQKYATRANWRGYTYIDDMQSEALVSLLNGTLKFDPEKSQNPFGYMTQIVTHSFLTTLDKEKKVRRIRDDILEQNGFSPSHTRQLENEAAAMERHRRLADEKEGIVHEEPDSDGK